MSFKGFNGIFNFRSYKQAAGKLHLRKLVAADFPSAIQTALLRGGFSGL